MNFFKNYYKHYFNKTGRLNRESFLSSFIKGQLIILLILLFNGVVFHLIFALTAWDFFVIDMIIYIPMVILIIPPFAYLINIQIKRLHDMNLSGWWCIGICVPFIGVIYLMILFLKRGTKGTNDFGDDPLIKRDSWLRSP